METPLAYWYNPSDPYDNSQRRNGVCYLIPLTLFSFGEQRKVGLV